MGCSVRAVGGVPPGIFPAVAGVIGYARSRVATADVYRYLAPVL